MSEEKPDEVSFGEDARVDALEVRLKAAHERENKRETPQAHTADANYRLGNRVLSDLLGGIFGGFVIGWVFDHFAGTSPWGLLVMLFFGTIVAFRNIIRSASGYKAGSDESQ